MDAAQITAILDATLPDRRVRDDLATKLERLARSAHKSKEIGDEAWRHVPEGASMDLVTKAFYSEYYEDVGFATYKVLVALGGLERSEVGAHKARYCFATLHYDAAAQLITIDFHMDFR